MQFLYLLESIRNPALTVLMEIARFFGDEMLPMALLAVLLFCLDKKTAYNIGFTFFLSGMVLNGMKITFRIPRPWVIDPGFKPIESATATATGYSFPSAHSQTAVSIYGTFAYKAKKTWLKVLCVVIFLMVGFSRMYSGVHTPADVCCGILLGLIVLVLEQKFIRPLIDAEDPAPIACVIVACITLIVTIIAATLVSKEILPVQYASDTIKTAGASFAFAISYYLDAKYIHFETSGTKLQYVIRLILGVGVALAIRGILKPLLAPIGLPGDFVRYAIMAFWVIAIYPALSMKYRAKFFSAS